MNNYKEIKFSDFSNEISQIKINTPLEEINELIQRIKKEIKVKNSNFKLLKSYCLEFIRRLPIPILHLDNLFVIRCRQNFNGEIFKTISQISYNKDKKKIKLNRFNLQNESAFYCSVPLLSKESRVEMTAILESCKEIFHLNPENKYIYATIGKWEIVKPLKIIPLTFYEAAFKKCMDLENINPVFDKFNKKYFKNEDYKKVSKFYNFFSKLSAKKMATEKDYLITNAFNQAVKKYYGNEVGILYSNSITENYGLNLVLSKEIIDNGSLQLSSVIMYKCQLNPITKKTFDIYPCSNISNIDENGKILITNLF